MKIAYIANSRFPSERAHMVQIVHMCNAFSQLGHSVTLVATDRRTDVTEDPEVYYGSSINFETEHLHVPDIAGNVHRIPRPLWAIAYTLQRGLFAKRCLQYSRQSKIDVVYGRDEWILWFLSFIIPMSKLVWESHEAKFNFPARSLLRKGVRCVAISEGIQDLYVRNSVPRSQLLVAHDGIDESFFGPVESKKNSRKRLGIPSDKPVVMYIGGLDRWKGITTFLEAASIDPEVLFVVIGGKEAEVKELRKTYPEILFLGPRPYRELKDNQQAADVLVVPNTAKNKLSSEYTSPLKLFAHMASGVPLIVSDLSSTRSVVNEVEATFFTPDDSKALGEVVQKVLEQSEIMKKKAQNAMIKSREFTWIKRAETIVRFIGM